MIELISRSWRKPFYELVSSAEHSLLLAAPFIKKDEARRLADAAGAKPGQRSARLTVLTDLRAESVLSDSLDIEALQVFVKEFEPAQVISVPRLHAKVYVADKARAIVGSANLTPSGLDQNMEYGILIEDPRIVGRIRGDLLRYGQLGSPVESDTLDSLEALGKQMKLKFSALQKSAAAGLRREFTAQLREARKRFIATQVGNRSANAVFSEAILYLLVQHPLATRDLHPRIQALLPDLCDDSLELVINGEAFGKKWKHEVRNAQQSLKRLGLIRFDGRQWIRDGR